MLRSPTATRVRRGLARRADALLSALRLVEPRDTTPPAAASSAWAEPLPVDDVVGPPIHPAPPADPVDAAPAATGPGLDRAAVQALLDEMVRPALQSDGGDITLVDVQGGDVLVELVGACHSCPSAVLTMKMGVEQLLAEELPGFQRLIQVNG